MCPGINVKNIRYRIYVEVREIHWQVDRISFLNQLMQFIHSAISSLGNVIQFLLRINKYVEQYDR